MTKSRKTDKGTVVADENANRIFVNIAREEGWNVTTISPVDRGVKLSDPQVVIKYTKGTHPIFTADKTAYKLTKEERGKSGYIIHKNPTKEEMPSYTLKVRDYFKNYTERHTHNMKWTIEHDGDHKKEKI